MSDRTVRRAVPSDASFLAGAIIAAESVPLDAGGCVYERVYGFTRDEALRFIGETLLADGTGHQLTLASFFVATDGDNPVGCCAAWVEGRDASPSGMTLALGVSRFLGRKRWNERAPHVRVLANNSPARTVGAIQLESFFVEPAQRGQGVTAQLILAVLAQFAEAPNPPHLAEISLFAENVQARRAYEKAGFAEAWRTPAVDADLQELTGSSGLVQLRRAL